MSKKYKRNELCWCDSGKKYKYCHFGRDKQEPISQWEAFKIIPKSFSKKSCLCPNEWRNNCSNEIVRAHSVSRKYLVHIANKNHVYHLKIAPEYFMRNQGKLKPRLIGVNDASTFTGFCGYHDNKIFSPLEDNSFQSTNEQCFLLAYRAICLALFEKQSLKRVIKYMKNLDRGYPILKQIEHQEAVEAMLKGAKSGEQALINEKKRLDNILINRQFNKVKYYILVIDNIPDIMCSGSITPEVDFHGNKLVDLNILNVDYDSVTISSFYSDGRGYLVFVWEHEPNMFTTKFIDSFDSLDDLAKSHAFVRLIFEFLDNIYLFPIWWDNLSNKDKIVLMDRATDVIFHPERIQKCLIDDNQRVVNWKIIKKISNISISKI